MAARHKSHRRWFLRDVPRTYMMLIWLGFCLTIVVYLNDWHPSGWSALRPQQVAKPKPQRSDAEIYTGSLIIMPAVGEKCQQLMMDNRTGRMWDKGIVNCYDAARRPKGPERSDQQQKNKCDRQCVSRRELVTGANPPSGADIGPDAKNCQNCN